MEAQTKVFVWGPNKNGQLRTPFAQKSPGFQTFKSSIKQISCGSDYSVYVSESGKTYSLGSNKQGQLGDPEKSSEGSSIPCQIPFLKSIKIIEVSCGNKHSVAVSYDGRAYSWGEGSTGALGLGSLDSQFSPVQIPVPGAVRRSSCGWRHSALLLSTKEVLLFGAGESGQLGTGRRDREIHPMKAPCQHVVQVSCGAFHTMFLDEHGCVFATGGTELFPQRVLVEKTRFIACGSHLACVTQNNDLLLWHGEPETPVKISPNVKEVAIGNRIAASLDFKGNLSIWKISKKIKSIVHREKGIRKVACSDSFCIGLGNGIKMKKHRRINSTVVHFNGQETENERLLETLDRSEIMFNQEKESIISFYDAELQSLKESLDLTNQQQQILAEKVYKKTEELYNHQYQLSRDSNSVESRIELEIHRIRQEISSLDKLIGEAYNKRDSFAMNAKDLEEALFQINKKNERLNKELDLQYQANRELDQEAERKRNKEEIKACNLLKSSIHHWKNDYNSLSEENTKLNSQLERLNSLIQAEDGQQEFVLSKHSLTEGQQKKIANLAAKYMNENYQSPLKDFRVSYLPRNTDSRISSIIRQYTPTKRDILAKIS